MPRGDGTGPIGMGPRTGKGMGYCAGYAAPQYASVMFGIGRGRGCRRMHHMTGLPGWACYGNYPYVPNANQSTAPEVNEKDTLQKQADFLEKQLGEVRERLKGFEQAE